MDTLPQKLVYNGLIYDLSIETVGTDSPMFLLTYEYVPVREDAFLVGVCGKTLDEARASMRKSLDLMPQA